MKSFLEKSNYVLGLSDFLDIFTYHKDCEEGSNLFNNINEVITDLELFFSNVYDGAIIHEDSRMTLEHILFFLTCYDRIPPFGLLKTIDVYFDKDITLPKVSTCGLTLVLPLEEVENKMKMAILFGGVGFGKP